MITASAKTPEPIAAGRRCTIATTLDLSRRSGPTDHLLGIACRLAERSCDVTVLCPQPLGSIVGARPPTLQFLHYANVGRLRLPSAMGSILALRKLWRLRTTGALYIRSSPGTLPITWLGQRAGYTSVVVEHNGWLGDEVAAFGHWSALSRAVAWCQVREARLASANRVVTAKLGAHMASHGIAGNNIAVIGNGTDTRAIRPLDQATCRAQLGIAGTSPPLLAFVGNLWPGAGLETALQALTILAARGRAVELIIAGDGIARAPLTAAAEHLLGADHGVRFMGHLSAADVNLVLGAADVALAPYLVDRNATIGISPLKMFTYAAAGRATVLSALPGTEVFASEPWVFMAAPGAPESLAAAIEAALAADRPQIATQARAFAELHDWSATVDQIWPLLFETRGRHSGPQGN